MGKILNMLWTLSIIGFFATFLAVYAYLPLRVGINSDAAGIANKFVTKEAFFYGGVGFFVLTNIVLYLFIRLVRMEAEKYRTANPKLFAFRTRLWRWIRGLSILVNLFFISVTLFIGIFNTTDSVGQLDYIIFIYLAPLLILGWLIYLGVIISRAVSTAS